MTHTNFSLIERKFLDNESLCDFEQDTFTCVFDSVLVPRLCGDFAFCDCYEYSMKLCLKFPFFSL